MAQILLSIFLLYLNGLMVKISHAFNKAFKADSQRLAVLV
ncbi:hypothetical protein IFVP136_C1220006 [Vibrio parahaemolyticus]